MKNKAMMPIFIAVVAVLMVALGIVIGVSIAKQNQGNGDSTQDITISTEGNGQDNEEKHPMYDRNIDTVLLLGVDSRDGLLGEGARSDSIIAVVLNHETKTIRIASILRDCYAKIEGYGYHKLNHANYYGGPDLAMDTVNTNYDLDISDYVEINFENLVELVDDIGGIDIDITQVECNRLGIARLTKPGTYTLSGSEALAYSRLRKLAGEDRARSERQRNVLFAIFEKTKTMSTEACVDLVEDMIDKVDTNFREDEMVELIYNLSRYKIEKMEAFPLVYYDGLVGDQWHEVPTTLIDMNTALHEFLYDYTEYEPSETVQQLSQEMSEVASEPNTDYR